MKKAKYSLFRLMALTDWIVALSIGGTSCGLLYDLQLHRALYANWVDPVYFAHRLKELILLSVASFTVGLSMWKCYKWSCWIETLLLVPKLYSIFFFFWLYKLSQSWLYLVVIAFVALDAGLVILLWSSHPNKVDLVEGSAAR